MPRNDVPQELYTNLTEAEADALVVIIRKVWHIQVEAVKQNGVHKLLAVTSHINNRSVAALVNFTYGALVMFRTLNKTD